MDHVGLVLLSRDAAAHGMRNDPCWSSACCCRAELRGEDGCKACKDSADDCKACNGSARILGFVFLALIGCLNAFHWALSSIYWLLLSSQSANEINCHMTELGKNV